MELGEMIALGVVVAVACFVAVKLIFKKKATPSTGESNWEGPGNGDGDKDPGNNEGPE